MKRPPASKGRLPPAASNGCGPAVECGIPGSALGTKQTQGFQLWIALPEELENAPCQSQYLSADEVPAEKPARVILGAHGRAKSAIRAPEGINYLDVQLAAGERWIYQPPLGHEVAWLAVAAGTLRTPEPVSAGELAVFEESSGALRHSSRQCIEVRARFRGETSAPAGARSLLGSHDSCGSSCGRVGDSTHRQSTGGLGSPAGNLNN